MSTILGLHELGTDNIWHLEILDAVVPNTHIWFAKTILASIVTYCACRNRSSLTSAGQNIRGRPRLQVRFNNFYGIFESEK